MGESMDVNITEYGCEKHMGVTYSWKQVPRMQWRIYNCTSRLLLRIRTGQDLTALRMQSESTSTISFLGEIETNKNNGVLER